MKLLLCLALLTRAAAEPACTDEKDAVIPWEKDGRIVYKGCGFFGTIYGENPRCDASKEARLKCPATCGTCTCEDAAGLAAFDPASGKKRTCNFYEAGNRCKRSPEAQQLCPITCNTCPDGCPEPEPCPESTPSIIMPVSCYPEGFQNDGIYKTEIGEGPKFDPDFSTSYSSSYYADGTDDEILSTDKWWGETFGCKQDADCCGDSFCDYPQDYPYGPKALETYLRFKPYYSKCCAPDTPLPIGYPCDLGDRRRLSYDENGNFKDFQRALQTDEEDEWASAHEECSLMHSKDKFVDSCYFGSCGCGNEYDPADSSSSSDSNPGNPDGYPGDSCDTGDYCACMEEKLGEDCRYPAWYRPIVDEGDLPSCDLCCSGDWNYAYTWYFKGEAYRNTSLSRSEDYRQNGRRIPVCAYDERDDYYCFLPDTAVVMADGATKPMLDVKIGDLLWGGSKVTGTQSFSAEDAELVDNAGVVSTRAHKILHDGVFMPAGAAPGAKPYDGGRVDYVHDLETDDHRITILTDKGELATYTDFTELDASPAVERHELGLLNQILSASAVAASS